MEFNNPKGIFLQIAEQISARILAGEWAEGERIPSIRELAVEIGVNPNTVTKTYQSLVDQGLIENRRGLGYFVTEQSSARIIERLRHEFHRDDLPKLCSKLEMLKINNDELVSILEEHRKAS